MSKTLKNADGEKYSNPADTSNGTKSDEWNKKACKEYEEFSYSGRKGGVK
jgi:hypothetical protein